MTEAKYIEIANILLQNPKDVAKATARINSLFYEAMREGDGMLVIKIFRKEPQCESLETEMQTQGCDCKIIALFFLKL